MFRKEKNQNEPNQTKQPQQNNLKAIFTDLNFEVWIGVKSILFFFLQKIVLGISMEDSALN